METKRLKLIPACLERAEEAHQAVVRSQKTLEVYLPWVPHVLTLEAMIEGTEKAIANFENFEESCVTTSLKRKAIAYWVRSA